MGAGAETDPHDGIPTDADGLPIFFVLPADLRARYAREMQGCEAGWKASRDPAFVDEAQIHAVLHRQPLPLWLSEAISELCTARRTKSHYNNVYNSAIRRLRYESVRDAQQGGKTWEEAYAAASEVLAGTQARGEPGTMKKAYCEVIADLKNGNASRYIRPLIPNMKVGDALRRKPPLGDASRVAPPPSVGHDRKAPTSPRSKSKTPS